MRHDHNNNESRTRLSANGSSQNGSSPHTNGSSKDGEANGFRTNGAALAHQPAQYHGHDREEMTRILLQTLSDMGYRNTARQLSKESGCELEIPSVAAFRSAIQNGEWEEAEAFLFGSDTSEEEGGVVIGDEYGEDDNLPSHHSIVSTHSKGLPLAQGADTTMLRFLIRQQKYLEFLEARQLNDALVVLRSELTPLKQDTARLHVLASLMMCQSAEDLRTRASWDGAAGESRSLLLSEVSQFISPAVMIPEHRLATLLSEIQEDAVLDCRWHNTTTRPSLYTEHECSVDDFPLHVLTELKEQSDEVWFITFSPDGTMLAAGGQEGVIYIYETSTWRLKMEIHEHERAAISNNDQQRRGVCYIAFSPDNKQIISCSRSNDFFVFNISLGRKVAGADHFDYPVTSAAWLPDSETFIIASHSTDRPLSLYSLRRSSVSDTSLAWNDAVYTWRDTEGSGGSGDNRSSLRITDCAISPDGARLAATTLDHRILIYDLATRLKVVEWKMNDRLTSICYPKTGEVLLISIGKGRLVTICSTSGEILTQYDGIKQANFVIRNCFGGADENLVASGSEDSRVYIWRRQTGSLIATLDGHISGTVNAVAWHPTDPSIFASAGDDRKVRV